MYTKMGISLCLAMTALGTVSARAQTPDSTMRVITSDRIGPSRAFAALKRERPPTIDGKLDDWAGSPDGIKLPFLGGEVFTLRYGGEKDLSAVFNVAWDAAALYVAARVTDDTHEQNEVNSDLWRHDSIQISIDPNRDRIYDGYAEDDVEVGVGLAGDGLMIFRWQPDPMEDPEGVTAKVIRTGTTTTYEVAIEWSVLGEFQPKHGAALGMALMVNDSDDGEERKGWLDWTPGVARYKRPFDFATVLLIDDAARTPAMAVDISRPWVLAEDGLSGRVLVGLPTALRDRGVNVKVQVAGGKILFAGKCPRGRLVEGTFSAGPGVVPAGDHTLAIQAGGALTTATVKVWDAASLANELLATLDDQMPILGVDLDLATGYQLEKEYSQMALRLILRLVDDSWRDLSADQSVRAARMAMQLKNVFDRGVHYIKGTIYTNLPIPTVPRYQTGPVKIQGRSFVARTYEPVTGEEEERPVFFNGFGHFDQVRKDLANWKELGTNLIQIEIGPAQVMPAEGRFDKTRFEAHVAAALEEAAQSDVAVCVLVSPHYFPQWALDKWPDLGKYSGGFFKHTIDAPQAKQIQEAFLTEILPTIAKQDALHSVCLSNEPVYLDSRQDPVTRTMWTKYLSATHKTIAAANQAWGTSHASFEAVPVPGPKVPDDAKALPLFYDWCVFNQQRLADWHQWEADVIAKLAPGKPVHARIMPRIFNRDHIANGVDPELFAKIGAINGNDCWALYDHDAKAEWTHDWLTMNTFLDLQASMREAPIYNSENHVIRDGDLDPIPPAHTYTVLWQQAVHGQCAETTWVWERSDDPKSDFAGSILNRPEHIFEHGRVHFDLMRLSKEVTALQNAPREVALLYSVASLVHQPAYGDTLRKVYTALNFTGHSVGYRSERQIAAGQWGETKLLIVPAATHVPSAVLEKIVAWQAGGGRVVTVGAKCLAFDVYGKPQPAGVLGRLKASSISASMQGAALRDALAKAADAAGAKTPATVTGLDGKPVWGVEWRAAKFEDRVVVNLVNLTREPVDLQINDGHDAWTDLHHQRWQRRQFRLAPQKPLLLQSGQDEDEDI